MKTIIITMILAVLAIGCGKKEETYGIPTPKNSKITTLSDVLKSPDQFHQKEITLKGVVDGQCGSRCEFFYREENEAVPIYMGNIEAPLIQKGTPVIVTASVHKGKEKLILTAKGFTLRPEGDK